MTTTERPPFSSLTRQHSRSSSQIATLATLSLTSTPSSPTRRPSYPGNSSPRFSFSGLSGYESPAVPASRNTSPDRSGKSSPAARWSRKSSLHVEEEEFKAPAPRTTTDPLSTETPAAGEKEESWGLAQLIQKKRRQASAPYLASARSSSLFSPGAGFGISALDAQDAGSSSWGGAPTGDDVRRTRSRQATRAATVGSLQLGVPWREEDGAGMVMTPTTEEWRQLGGQLSELADLRAKDEAKFASTLVDGVKTHSSSGANSLSTSSSSSSIDLTAMNRSISEPLSRHPSGPSIPVSRTSSSSSLLSGIIDPPTPPVEFRPMKSSFSYQSSSNGFSHSTTHSFDARPLMAPSTAPIPASATFKPSHRPQKSESSARPNLSRGSLSSTTGEPVVQGSPSVEQVPQVVQVEQQPMSAVLLDWVHNLGPVDPKKYSAVTGLRGIHDFVIEGEAGKGAYGTVRKAREKGPDGKAMGPELIIKYVIKQRILADCWKKHKILGPIPIEVHVLDHLRRVPYAPRARGRRREGQFVRPLGAGQRRDSAPSLVEGTVTGHPNICGMLDFFEDGEFYYLVMPQAGADPEAPNAPGGQDLFDYVDLHPDGLPISSIRRIFAQIADALYFLHEHGIVHRDIKDENVVLDHLGNVQVIDFGSAAYVKEGKKFDTFSGTLDFAAPEVLRGARYGGKETDIWALGVLGYVIICGECPFWSPEEAMRGLFPSSRAEQALRAKVSLSSPASSLSSSDEMGGEGTGLMEDAVDLVMRCLEVDPEERPSADQVLDHRFVLGVDGWRGSRGWLAVDG